MSDEDEFYEDFGAPAISNGELERLLGQARAMGDPVLRRLVHQHRTLKRTAGWVVDTIDESQDLRAVSESEPTRLLRFLVGSKSDRGETPLPG